MIKRNFAVVQVEDAKFGAAVNDGFESSGGDLWAAIQTKFDKILKLFKRYERIVINEGKREIEFFECLAGFA